MLKITGGSNRMDRRNFVRVIGLATGAGAVYGALAPSPWRTAAAVTAPTSVKEYGLLECTDQRLLAAFSRARRGILACTVNEQTHCCDAGRSWGTDDALNDLYFGLHGGLLIGDQYQHQVFRNELRKIGRHVRAVPGQPPVPWSVSADGRKALFNPDPGYDMDRCADFVLEVVRTYEMTGDRQFALDLHPHCLEVVKHLAGRDLDGDFLPEGRTTWFDDPGGKGGACASVSYIGDTVGNTWKDFGASLFYFEALRRLALLEGLLGKETEADRHREQAAKVRDAVRRVLWNDKSDGFFAWIERNGKTHDDWITGNNLHAVSCGLATAGQGVRILRKLEAHRQELEEVVPCRVRLGTYAEGLCSNRPDYYWNGGSWTLVSAPDMLARTRMNDLAGALRVATLLATRPQVTDVGFYEAYDGKTGEPNRCRGLLMNNGGFIWGFIEGVMGVEIVGDELRFRSSIPANILPARARLHYRGADLEIQWVVGRSPSATLDGKRLNLESGYYRPELLPEPERIFRVEIVTTRV